jgi:hypothetical protein
VLSAICFHAHANEDAIGKPIPLSARKTGVLMLTFSPIGFEFEGREVGACNLNIDQIFAELDFSGLSSGEDAFGEAETSETKAQNITSAESPTSIPGTPRLSGNEVAIVQNPMNDWI